MSDRLKQEVMDLKDEIIAWRRDFHQHPELGMQERRTSEKAAGLLGEFGLEVTAGLAGHGVVGLLEGKRPGRTVLLRADMDALPVNEENDVPYRSRNPGVMHACGHDGHTAILLGVAKVLSARRRTFSGQIKFVFQPAEETFAGARPMIEEGVLRNPEVDAAFALHLMTHIQVGRIDVKPGAIMAGADWFGINIIGKGAHGAMPQAGADAILMGAQVVSALQSLISREVSPLTPLVVHVGKFNGGQAFNIMAERVELEGTVRTLNETLQKSMPERMDRILKGITGAFRGVHELAYVPGCPPVINDEAMTELVREAAIRVVGEDMVIQTPAVMGSEDMALILKEVPGCYFFVGAANPEKGLDQPHHNSRFDFDEEALIIGAETMIRTALNFLSR